MADPNQTAPNTSNSLSQGKPSDARSLSGTFRNEPVVLVWFAKLPS